MFQLRQGHADAISSVGRRGTKWWYSGEGGARMDVTANFGSKAGLNGNISVASRGQQYHSDILQ